MYPKGAPTSSSVRIGQQLEMTEDKSARAAVSTMSGAEWREEYWYVYNDLKRIAMLAGTLLAILIVLSFII